MCTVILLVEQFYFTLYVLCICQMCYKYIIVEYISIGIILNFYGSYQPIERTTLDFAIKMQYYAESCCLVLNVSKTKLTM